MIEDQQISKFECDLHCHTNRSDGNDTPKMLIDRAVSLGMKAIAITDHDVAPPDTITVNDQAINIRSYAQQQGLNIVLGCEFSTDTYVSDVHIIGYELDWNDFAFKKEMEKSRKSKSEAYKRLTVLLTAHGLPIDYETEILRYTDQDGQEQYRKPEDVEKKFIFEKMAEKGYASNWGEAKIMVTDSPELNIPREKIDPLWTIELIHQCGGLAVLAHPYLIDSNVKPQSLSEMTRSQYINRLIENGLDGIEARYTYNKTSYKGSKSIDQIEKEVKNLYGDRLFISGGSDYHAGGKKGIKNPREIGEAGIDYIDFKTMFKSIIDII